MRRRSGYKPIADYGAIGNTKTVAFVCSDGSIDWCCLPQIDSPSVFAALLDTHRGGYFQVSVQGAARGEQRYLEDTAILETRFRSGGGVLTVTDLMPIRGDIQAIREPDPAPEIHRILECVEGRISVEVAWSPRLGYASLPVRIESCGDGQWCARGGGHVLSLSSLEGAEVLNEDAGPALQAGFLMRTGEQRALVTRWGEATAGNSVEDSLRALNQTASAWKEWVNTGVKARLSPWAGAWHSAILRSALTLKMLSYAGSGAILAAATTSLPEAAGGQKNWDYRYSWIRDAALTAQVLTVIGHKADAIRFLQWMSGISEKFFGDHPPHLQPLYNARGGEVQDETVLAHLEGYRGSRPVRIGNAAKGQLQLGTYGYILETGYELAKRGWNPGEETREFLRRVADRSCDIWREPDQGIWESRDRPRQYVHSKAMVWMGLSRAVAHAEDYGLSGDVERWRRETEVIKNEILANGYDEELGSFVSYYGSKYLDAANLRIPLFGLVPFRDARVQGTIDRTLEDLTRDGFVYRFSLGGTLPRGDSGKEGATFITTLWLVDALALSGRLDEAREIFGGVLSSLNHVGLLSEMIDTKTGEFLGNFPQSYTHIGLINSAISIAYAEGRDIPGYSPIWTQTRGKGDETHAGEEERW